MKGVNSVFAAWRQVPAALLVVPIAVFLVCDAAKAGSCPPFLTLANDIVSGMKVESACGPINAGPNYTVTPTGTLLLQSTDSVALKDGFKVENGGKLKVGTPPTGALSSASGGSGSIPDNSPSGLELTFNVAGIVQPVKRVRVTLTIHHTYIGDLTATLRAPFGVAQLVLFGRPGYRLAGSSGVSSNLDGTYVFDDFGLDCLWDAIDGLPTGSTVPPGTYRTSTAAPFRGSTLLSNAGGCSTYLSGAFAGLDSGEANGAWTLEIVDAFATDTGTVSAATLEIEQGSSPLNRISGFVKPGECTPAPYDLTGTGRTSYSYVSDDSGFLRWHVKGNDGSASGQTEQTYVVGNPLTDFWLPADFDGDGIADAAAWGPDPAPPGTYRVVIRRSSRPNDDLLELPIGAVGDNPTVYGDYDGDRVADPAVLRSPVGAAGQDVVFETLLSTEGGTGLRSQVLTQTTSSSLRPYPPGDVTGDGINDIATLRNGTWTVYDGVSGSQIGSTFAFGSSLDPVIYPGDFVGNTFGDFTRVFVVGSDVTWQTRDGQTGAVGSEITWGALVPGFAEFTAAGDYDGDGKMDLGVWRRDSANGNVPCTPDVIGSRFIIRQSSNGALLGFCYGAAGAAPVPGANAN